MVVADNYEFGKNTKTTANKSAETEYHSYNSDLLNQDYQINKKCDKLK